MIDNLTISPHLAIETLEDNSIGETDLELNGISDLCHCGKDFEYALKCSEINDDNTFLKVFGVEKNFIYIIKQVCDNTVINYERGIGHIYKKNNKFFLKRLLSFYYSINRSKPYKDPQGKPYNFICNKNKFQTLVVSSYPENFIECLAPKHSVITSSESCFPQSVPFKQNSFLLRFDEQIENVDLDDKRLIPHIVKLISDFTKQLKLSTSKLIAKRAETELLDLKPTVNPKPKVGSIYYDKDNDQVKVYTSNGWRTLSYLEDNKK